ncbi:MAG: response regulator transcription factor [Flavobacteriales bacterium]|nr:response regulator transcription factor [Flavobacteriales bacterium]
MKEIRAIVVEDEPNNRDNLLELLKKYCPGVEVIATAYSGLTGIETILKHQPDLVFLDVEMPDGNGFDVLEKTTSVEFEVVFTTAYDQYALQAFKFCALDYLLKPIDISELIAAIDKVKKLPPEHSSSDQFAALAHNFNNAQAQSKKIGLPTRDGLLFVSLTEIIRCESDGPYTTFHLVNDSVMVSKSIGEYEELLEGFHFYRVHQSHIINLNCVNKYIKGEGGSLIMADDAKIPVSRRKKEHFLSKMEEL